MNELRQIDDGPTAGFMMPPIGGSTARVARPAAPMAIRTQVVVNVVIGLGVAAILACDRAPQPAVPHSVEPRLRPAGDTLIITPCTVCDVRIEHLLTIGQDYEAPLTREYTLQRMRDGRYVYASEVSGGEMHVLQRDGTYSGTVGRTGPGPGEYGWIQHIVALDTQVLIFDTQYRRRTILTPELSFVRQDPIPAQAYSATMAGESLTVANMMIRSGEHAGLRLHILRPDGSIIRSFDPTNEGRTYQLASDFRPLASSGSDTIYAAHWNEYRIDEWLLTGERSVTFLRDAPWFEPWTGRCCWTSPTDPPPSRLHGLRLDAEGRLWMLITVADSAWATTLKRSTLDPTFYEVEDSNRAYDTVVEVIDPLTGRMLGSGRFDEWFIAFAGDQLVSSYREDARTLRSLLDVWALRLPSR